MHASVDWFQRANLLPVADPFRVKHDDGMPIGLPVYRSECRLLEVPEPATVFFGGWFGSHETIEVPAIAWRFVGSFPPEFTARQDALRSECNAIAASLLESAGKVSRKAFLRQWKSVRGRVQALTERSDEEARALVREAVAADAGQPTRRLLEKDDWGEWRFHDVETCLSEFLDLETAEPAAILDFAQYWGVLGICQHGRPHLHDTVRFPCSPLWDATPVFPWFVEPISAWRRLSKQLGLLLSIATDLSQGRRGRPEDWSGLAATAPPTDDESRRCNVVSVEASAARDAKTAGIAQQREILTDFVNHTWFAYSGLGPHLVWPDDAQSTVTLTSRSRATLPSILAAQLATMLVSRTGLYRCDECGRTFTPEKRRPAVGRAVFCGLCQDGPARLAAKRRWWRLHRGRGSRTTLAQPGEVQEAVNED